jgi:hypothetical protein
MKREEFEKLAAEKSSKVFKQIFIDKERKCYEFEPYLDGEYIQIMVDGNPVFPNERLMFWIPEIQKIQIDVIHDLFIDYESIDKGYIILSHGSEFKKLLIMMDKQFFTTINS